MYKLNRERLMIGLRAAYADACRSKRNKLYVKHFESRRDENLSVLCDELLQHCYLPSASLCFIINDPKKREVFAADFRDRIVHHLYYNMVHEMLERTFIADSYSCIKGRGTHYGIRRLEHHIRVASENYTKSCYVLKLDIRGYFMHIERHKLLAIVLGELRKLYHRSYMEGEERLKWRDVVDIDFVEYLTEVFVLNNPLLNCKRKGDISDWKGLPFDKSLFNSPEGCGLPIGNLTSQLFSNVFLNRLDQYMKRTLKCKHYGRYVDDFFVVSTERERLVEMVPLIRNYLLEELGLQLHEGKIVISDVRQGVSFLGYYVKPWRRYVVNHSLRRLKRKLHEVDCKMVSAKRVEAQVNSYIGVLSHGRSYRILRKVLLERNDFWRVGDFVYREGKWRFRVESM